MLFADVRGYTKLTAGLSAAEVPALVNRFYETASKALLSHEGLLGQIEGDNVMSLFVPGLAGPHYRRSAVEAGRSLLQAIGPGSELSLDVGVGISSGEEFVGMQGDVWDSQKDMFMAGLGSVVAMLIVLAIRKARAAVEPEHEPEYAAQEH